VDVRWRSGGTAARSEEAPVTRAKFEFPTEWTLCPDSYQDDREELPLEEIAKDQNDKIVEPPLGPWVRAAGASAQE